MPRLQFVVSAQLPSGQRLSILFFEMDSLLSTCRTVHLYLDDLDLGYFDDTKDAPIEIRGVVEQGCRAFEQFGRAAQAALADAEERHNLERADALRRAAGR